jgi:hypothetical protein
MATKKRIVQTTQDPPEVVRANIDREVILSPDFVSLYANDTQVQITPWDIRFMFGVVQDPPNKERPTVLVKQVGEVRMSPQHAKVVALVLLRQIQNYEKVVGQIPIPNEPAT